MKLALVLSGGGMFGAWQSGAWRTLAEVFSPDLIVGASVGSLVGYAIAGGATPDELRDFWITGDLARMDDLDRTTSVLCDRYQPKCEYAAVITDVLRVKPMIVRGCEITPRHLYASCAVPLIVSQRRLHGRWCTDGGLLNPLPVWAAEELGATHIVGVHALPRFPMRTLEPCVKLFRWVAGHNPPLRAGIELEMVVPSVPLGSLRDAARWDRVRSEGWLEQGAADAQAAARNISVWNCLRR
jgi:NTE family protein